MSKSSGGGISIGTIIFWVFMMNIFGFCDGEDKKTTEIVVDDKPSVTETVTKAIDDVKPELEKAAVKAKEIFEEVRTEMINDFEETKSTEHFSKKKEKVEVKLGDKYDRISEDKYGSSESLY
jgi:hypothetical protein